MSEYPVLDSLFGLDSEQKIVESGVREVFTPHHPIDEIDLLVGRSAEVRKMVATLNTPGQHVLVYGQRGVGKSSLAKVVSLIFVGLLQRKMFEKRCDRETTFESIMQGPLAEVGGDITLAEITETVDVDGRLGGKLASAGRRASQSGTYRVSGSISPSTVAEQIRDLDALLVVDEVDAIGSADEKFKLAELIKLLSDSKSKFKIMVVGIATTSEDLTSAHPSVKRCLRETKLDRIADKSLKDLVTNGAQKVGLTFTPKVTASIVRLSAGYPYFTHLIALKCAEEAIAQDRREIREQHLREALDLAVGDAEETLKRAYDTAVRSASTEKYKEIVIAASLLVSEEFSAPHLREAIESYTGDKLSQGSLNNFLKRLVSNDGASILRRTAKGVYKFSDPRMASYVRMVTANVTEEADAPSLPRLTTSRTSVRMSG